MESRSRADLSPDDVRRCPLKEDKPFISQLPPPLLPAPLPPTLEETLVVSAAELLLLCLGCGWERGAEELLNVYFQEGMALVCLLGLTTMSPLPDEDPSFGPGFGLGVWVGVTAAHSLASRDEALLCSSWSVLETGQLWRSSSDIQAPRLRCWR